jgi:membrane protease YdiL (CAAX protease family)
MYYLPYAGIAMTPPTTRTALLLFTVATLVSSALAWGFGGGVGAQGEGLGHLLALLMPALWAVLLDHYVLRENLFRRNLAWPGLGEVARPVVVVAAMLLTTVVLDLATGVAQVEPDRLWSVLRWNAGLAESTPALAVLAWTLLSWLVNSLAFTLLFEEIAWRGYLQRHLHDAQWSPLTATLLVAGVWWLWHLPIYATAPAIAGRAWLIPLQYLFFLNVSLVFAWSYRRTRSVWPVGVAHATWNHLNQRLLGAWMVTPPQPGVVAGPLWLVNGELLMGVLATSIYGLLFAYLLARDARRHAARV